MRLPQRGLAALRIVVGLWFLKSVLTKLGLVWLGVVPLPGASARWQTVMPRLLARYAAENPVEFYRDFLLHTVIPNSAFFATLTALGETAVGLGLTLGLLTPLASVVGLVLVVSYGLATSHMGPSQQGFHVLLFACMAVFLLTRAGRAWGVDGWLRARRGRSWLARSPLT